MISRFTTINKKSRKLINKIIKIDDQLQTEKLICTRTDGIRQYDFMLPFKFTLKIYSHNLTLQEAKDDQQELKILINKLNNKYNPRNQEKIEEKIKVIKSAKILYSIREEIIDAFKKGIFPYIGGFQAEKETDEETDEEMDTTIMPKLESEESAAEKRNQQGKGVKILTPSQMFSRLPISLAQLKAGNNSEKLKNEIRQLLYSLYRSKNMTKQIYNNLIK